MYMRPWRKRAGLTINQLAALLDVTETTIRNWEKGRVHPGRRMGDIARELGLSGEAQLYTRPPEKTKK